MGKHVIETIMGAVVLIVAVGFLYFAYHSTQVSASTNGYTLHATFDKIDGIALGSDVRISGIKVGSVTSQSLNPQSFLAELGLTIDNTIKLPADSSAAIVSEGLLGGKYIALEPGGEEDTLKNGDKIQYTQSSVNIETLIGKFMFSGDKSDKSSEGNTSEPAETPKKPSNSLSIQ